MNKITISLLLLYCTLAAPSVWAQPGNPQHHLDTSLIRYFSGHWAGEGSFANGKPIASDLFFHLSLDSSWLVYEHQDRAPNFYKATSFWGVDRSTGEFIAYNFDNFQGHRQFASNGWKDGKLVLTGHAYYPQAGLYFEHFIYEKLSDSRFKMTYEVSRDGITWQLGDQLVFKKND